MNDAQIEVTSLGVLLLLIGLGACVISGVGFIAGHVIEPHADREHDAANGSGPGIERVLIGVILILVGIILASLGTPERRPDGRGSGGDDRRAGPADSPRRKP